MKSLRSRMILASVLWTAGLLMLMHMVSLLFVHFFPRMRGAHSVFAIGVAAALMLAGLAALMLAFTQAGAWGPWAVAGMLVLFALLFKAFVWREATGLSFSSGNVPVTVAGADRSAIDITAVPPVARTLSGTVRSAADGTPIAGAFVHACEGGSWSCAYDTSAVDGSDRKSTRLNSSH